MGDTGLLVTQIMKSSNETGDNIYKSLIFDKLGINQGMIIENVIIGDINELSKNELSDIVYQFLETC